MRTIALVFFLILVNNAHANELNDPLASQEAMDRYKQIYSLLPVKALRKAIDQYRGLDNSSPAVLWPKVKHAMSKVNQQYFENRFTVYRIEPTWGGMIQIDIMFQKMSDDIFSFFLYKTSDRIWEVRHFIKQNVKKEMVDKLHSEFGQYINNEEYSM